MSRWISVILAASRPLAVVAVVLLGAGLVGAAVTPVGDEAAVLSDVAAARALLLLAIGGSTLIVGLLTVVVARERPTGGWWPRQARPTPRDTRPGPPSSAGCWCGRGTASSATGGAVPRSPS